MARRLRKSESEALGILIVLGVIAVGIVKFFEAVGFVLPILVVGSIIAVIVALRQVSKKQRIEYLRTKYGDEEIVQRIMNRTIWQGQSSEQVADSLGNPVEIDNKVLKTKKKEIWKYEHQGGTRFNLRITLDNDIVVGWDKKG
jgi:uncharacterized membrane protein